MTHQSLSTCPSVAPSQVWGCLGHDHRTKIIQFMAQLAFNLVASQSALNGKEPTDAHNLKHPQDSTRTP